MSTISCGYRIYPAWFGGDTGAAIQELADVAAAHMGRESWQVRTDGTGFDRRGGHYIDFTITYASTEAICLTL